ncbi:VC0807 family protein [Nonomuraea sp. NPDC004354]
MNRSIVSVVLWDVAPMVAAYYAGRALGVGEYLAMLAASCVGLLRVGYVAVSKRRLDGFAAFTSSIFAIGLVLSLMTGDEKFILALKSVTTAVVGVIFLGTVIAGRPAAFAVAKRFGAEDTETAARWDVLYAAEPRFRRVYVVMTLVWGVAMLAESAARLPLVYLLPTDVMVTVSTVMLLGTMALLGLWSAWYGKRGELRTRPAA